MGPRISADEPPTETVTHVYFGPWRWNPARFESADFVRAFQCGSAGLFAISLGLLRKERRARLKGA